MITIKQATEIHSELLASIYADSFQDQAKPWSSEVMRKIISNKNNHIAIAYLDESKPYGFIIYTLISQIQGEVLSVGSVKKRSGIGKALMDSMISHAQAEGVGEIFLEVAIDNNPAILLYEKFAFKELSIRKNYYKRNNIFIDAKIMSLQLA